MLLAGWAVACGDSAPPANEPQYQPPGASGDSGSGNESECQFDQDKDGYCDARFSSTDDRKDCDDRNPDINPEASEAPNAIDDNCDGVIDEGVSAACPLTQEEPASGCEAATQLVAGSSHACVLTDAGRVLCWGSNGGGALGVPDLTNSPVPLAVPGVQDATSVAVTSFATCALVAENAICWGAGSAYPFYVALPPKTTQLALAHLTDQGGWLRYYLYALDAGGKAYQRALFAQPDAATPPVVGTEFVEAATGIKQLVAGGGEMCALTGTDALVCFNAAPPTEIAPAVVDFAVMGVDKTLCYKTGGELYCGDTAGPGAKIAGNGSAIGAATSAKLSCAFNAAGKVGCWSGGGPTSIGDATALVMGNRFGCILRTSGKVSCFGNDDGGMLGDGRTKPSVEEVEPVDVLAAPTIQIPAVVLLGSSPLGACDSLTDLSTFTTYAPQAHVSVAACKEQCATLLDSESCFASCANVPGITPACLGCYTALATCEGAGCYQAFIACAGYPSDFAQSTYNAPRFECLGAQCLRGTTVGQPCETGFDCLSGSCDKLPQAGEALLCVTSDGADCTTGSPFCTCATGTDSFGPRNSGHCGGCYGDGRIESGYGDCHRDCSQESFCAEGQECRTFSNSQNRYCSN